METAMYRTSTVVWVLTLLAASTSVSAEKHPPLIAVDEENGKHTAREVLRDGEVPVSTEPEGPVWRFGFRFEDGTVLLRLFHQQGRAMRDEASRMLGEPSASSFHGIVQVPLSAATSLSGRRILNPEHWTVVDADGSVSDIAFRWLAVYGSTDFGSTGGFLLASDDLDVDASGRKEVARVEGLVIGLAGPRSRTPVFHVPSPLERDGVDSAAVPEPAPLLASGEAQTRIDAWTTRNLAPGSATTTSAPFRARVDGMDRSFALIRYGWHSAQNEWEQEVRLWLLARQDTEGRWLVVYVVGPSCYQCEEPGRGGVTYEPRLTGVIDLDDDGTDEIIVTAHYYEGKRLRVLGIRDGEWREIDQTDYEGL
jgi:hypothetical protein